MENLHWSLLKVGKLFELCPRAQCSNTYPPKSEFFSFPSVDRNGKFALAIMTNDSGSAKPCHRAKLPITTLTKFWLSGFLSVDRNGKSALFIIRKWKNDSSSAKHILEQNFQLPIPTKFGSLVYLVSTEMKILHWLLWQNGSSSAKNAS